ncbi:MAG: hypothetical protein M5U31_16365 [Acidimicrobiia bacterium]|nr:hypothetical protein [Acidimicrobiia bacterium]
MDNLEQGEDPWAAQRVLLVGVVVAALFATGCEWNFETLDGHQNGPSGQVSADVGAYGSSVIYNGRPHVFYYASGGDLRHAY